MTDETDGIAGRMLGVSVAGETKAVDMTGALGLGLGGEGEGQVDMAGRVYSTPNPIPNPIPIPNQA